MMPNMDGLELTRRLRATPHGAVSVILLTARGLSADKLEGFAVGADDYIVKPFDTPELLARIRGVLRRAKEMRAQSPLTGLPGNVRIQDEIEERVTSARPFAILYTDLDYFKAYNDHYGFARGDQVIQYTAQMLQEVAPRHRRHRGIRRPRRRRRLRHRDRPAVRRAGCRTHRPSASTQESPQLYDEADRARGAVELTSRTGELQRYPLLSISIGVATTEHRSYSHFAEAVAIATEMKSFTKQQAGSSWALDRRTF